MKIFLASDHAGFDLKAKLAAYLSEAGHEVSDLGASELNPQDDYPEIIARAARAVGEKPGEYKAIILGGSGQGEAMVANRFPGVRAAVYYGAVLAKDAIDVAGTQSIDPYEIVRLSRKHNDANILSVGVRFVTEMEAKEIVQIWLTEEFSGDERHMRRIAQIETVTSHT